MKDAWDLSNPIHVKLKAEYEALQAREREKNNGHTVDDSFLANHTPLPAFSDEALALRFAEQHEDDLRYVAAWNRWLRWTGTHWLVDDTLGAFDLVRIICREAASECNKGRIAVGVASAKTVAAVERLARADRRLAATVDQWDADSWLLNTPAGTIDLRTGRLAKHDPGRYCTKITAVGPGGDCPRFLAFLDRITGGDKDLQAYLRRVLGYCLTGSTREHALFFAYGTGANGKSVLLSTVAGIVGDYHVTSSVQTFIASNNDRHLTELARLRGARLVTATETEEGRRWAESRIKELTGGDVIAANFMRQDLFEFRPAFKLIIAGNHKPALRSVDEAIRRRFHLIPFAVTIPAEERDLDLAEKLKAEWPGILAWCIEGALEWETEGLRPPQAVLDATAAYLQSEDAIAAWIDDRCDRLPSAWSASGALFASWNAWATASGEATGSVKRFSQALEDRGFQRRRTRTAQGFYGLAIRVTDYAR
jgi:putative DNA primase/helicase